MYVYECEIDELLVIYFTTICHSSIVIRDYTAVFLINEKIV